MSCQDEIKSPHCKSPVPYLHRIIKMRLFVRKVRWDFKTFWQFKNLTALMRYGILGRTQIGAGFY